MDKKTRVRRLARLAYKNRGGEFHKTGMIGNNTGQRSGCHITHNAILFVGALFQNADWPLPFGTELDMRSCRRNPYKRIGVEQTGLRKPSCGQPSRFCVEAVDQVRENFRQDFSFSLNLVLIPIQE